MARVSIIAAASGTYKDGMLRGKPSGVGKITTVNASFGTAGNPDYRIPANTEAIIVVTDTAIDMAVVRTDNPATAETAVPIPLALNGLTQYVMYLEDGDNDVFVRQMV